MSAIYAPEDRPLTLRQLIVLGSVMVCLAGFCGRLWQLQIQMSDEIRERAARTAVRSVKTQPPRGRIFDRNGILVAGVQPIWVVRMIPQVLARRPKEPEEAWRARTDPIKQRVAEILGIKPEDIDRDVKEAPISTLPCVIYVGATFIQAMRIAESRSLLPGFDVEMTAARKVEQPLAYSHVLGYVGRLTAQLKDSLKKDGIEPVELVGRDGIERMHEKELMGSPGEDRMAVDARMRPVSRVSQKEPVPGSRLYLTLDDRLQKEAQSALSGQTGALAMIDTQTGELLAFASSPSYSLDMFSGGISKAEYSQLLNDPRKPLIRRPTSGTYSPGSTFKIVTALAAARQGMLDLNRQVYCDGGRRVGPRLVACHNHSRGMSLNFAEALRLSCNTYFVDLALRVGPVAMHQAAVDLGLGSKTGIDLPSENKGNIPDGKTAREMGRKRTWYPGDTANFGIGQGDVLVTPLQMAQLASIVAMDGVGHQPHLVRAVQASSEVQPRLLPPGREFTVEAPAGFWATIRQAMGRVVSSGTARRAQIPGLEWGGKTGSSEHSQGGKTHSWFIGFAPLHEPRVAIAVLAEEAGHGGEVSAPIAGRLVARWHQLETERSASKPASMADTDSVRP